MLQHVFLTLVAPPLLILGIPGRIIDNLIKSKIQIFIFKRLLHPITIFFIFNLVFSIWHMPILYNLSVNNHSVHVFEHFTFIFSAFAMWWPIFNKSKNLPRISFPAQMIYIFLLSVAQIIVFGIITQPFLVGIQIQYHQSIFSSFMRTKNSPNRIYIRGVIIR
mgnify:CR=1 FL=1